MGGSRASCPASAAGSALSPTGTASVVLQEKGGQEWEGLRNNLSISQAAGRNSSRCSANRLEGKEGCHPSPPRRSRTRKGWRVLERDATGRQSPGLHWDSPCDLGRVTSALRLWLFHWENKNAWEGSLDFKILFSPQAAHCFLAVHCK